MSETTDGILEGWASRLVDELGLETRADVDAILRLAGVAAHSVVRPAAPLTTYLAGYAAGIAAASGSPAPDLRRIEELAREFGAQMP